ncbi:competence/damage-inducible CinA C-terminal domain protein [Mycobacterium avium subsp. avium 2285 (R)]|nr:competence/damage-inducible CinA C-terminal domain protein [Mycobacterium avium subsp. avium 2285 (R)]
MWHTAIQTPAAQQAIAGRTVYRQEMLRMFGLPESGLAETLREAEAAVPGFGQLEITTCLRRGEIEMVTRYEPTAATAYAQLTKLLRDKHGDQLYSEDGSRVDDLVARLLAGRRIATAESCTAGLLAARLTDRPGSSDYVAGGVVAYSNEAKAELLGVDPALIETHGAVSEPVAQAMAAGARQRFAADTAVAITGIAGPGGVPRRSRWERCASACRSAHPVPRPARTPAPCGFRATGWTSASARRRWPCTCCGAC